MPRPLSILYITNQLDIGGLETSLVRLARQLASRGHKVSVAARPGLLSEALDHPSIVRVPLTMRRTVGSMRHDQQRLQSLLRDTRFDIVHSLSASGTLLLNAAGVRHYCKSRGGSALFFTTIMGLVNRPNEHRALTMARARATNWKADRILATSPAIAHQVASALGKKRPLIKQHIQSVELIGAHGKNGHGSSLRDELGLPARQRIVTTIGRLDPSKSHDLFIRAADIISKKRNDVTFLIVGGGRLKQELATMIDDLKLQDQVLLLDDRDDVHDILRQSDVCVRPGIVEGFVGMTVLEAQMTETPVISFETQDVKMAIEHGRTGILVPPDDYQSLAQEVLALLDDTDQARQMATAARVQVEQRFSAPSVAAALEQRYYHELGLGPAPANTWEDW